VPAVGPESAAAPDQGIDRARDLDGEAAHSARKFRPAARLDDQVDVVVLDREMSNPETPRIAAAGIANGEAKGRQHELGAQRTEQGSERDDDRMAG
jgi:hypothetical protein